MRVQARTCREHAGTIGTPQAHEIHGLFWKEIEMAGLEEAIVMAAAAHRLQTDMGGQHYILHPLRVMFAMNTEQHRIVAVLHDVVEDSNVPLERIRDMFGDRIASAVDALTKRDDETYDDYLRRVAADEIAVLVKLADLKDNCDLNRLGRAPTVRDRERLDKYLRARAILQSAPDAA